MSYAKKYGTCDSDYVSNKLLKSFELANNSINKITQNKAEELFDEGMTFESYFIEEAINGNMVRKISKQR